MSYSTLYASYIREMYNILSGTRYCKDWSLTHTVSTFLWLLLSFTKKFLWVLLPCDRTERQETCWHAAHNPASAWKHRDLVNYSHCPQRKALSSFFFFFSFLLSAICPCCVLRLSYFKSQTSTADSRHRAGQHHCMWCFILFHVWFWHMQLWQRCKVMNLQIMITQSGASFSSSFWLYNQHPGCLVQSHWSYYIITNCRTWFLSTTFSSTKGKKEVSSKFVHIDKHSTAKERGIPLMSWWRTKTELGKRHKNSKSMILRPTSAGPKKVLNMHKSKSKLDRRQQTNTEFNSCNFS